MSARRAKVMGRFSQLAVAATRLALEDAKVPEVMSKNMAICFGTSVSGLEVAVDGVHDFVAKGPGEDKALDSFLSIPRMRPLAIWPSNLESTAPL